MPRALSPIPLGVAITDDDGAITVFFRLRWEELINGFQIVPAVATVQALSQSAAIATTAAYTTTSAGLYRMSYYTRKTAADGVNSSLTVTVGWQESGVALTESAAALTADAITAQQSGTKVMWADAATDITYAVAYTSNTPGNMHYRIDVSVERIG